MYTYTWGARDEQGEDSELLEAARAGSGQTEETGQGRLPHPFPSLVRRFWVTLKQHQRKLHFMIYYIYPSSNTASFWVKNNQGFFL